MKKLMLLILASSMLSACGSDGVSSNTSPSLSSDSSFSLSDVRAPAAGKINLIFNNLESKTLTGALFSSTGSTGSFTDLLPSATSFPGGNYVVYDQAPATYSYNYKFGSGTTAVTSPTKTTSLLASGKNVSMGANQTNTGTVVTSTPVSSTSTPPSTSGYTCSSTSYTSKCPTLNTCVSSSGSGSGYYQTSAGTFSWSNPDGISAAAQAAVNACL